MCMVKGWAQGPWQGLGFGFGKLYGEHRSSVLGLGLGFWLGV